MRKLYRSTYPVIVFRSQVSLHMLAYTMVCKTCTNSFFVVLLSRSRNRPSANCCFSQQEVSFPWREEDTFLAIVTVFLCQAWIRTQVSIHLIGSTLGCPVANSCCIPGILGLNGLHHTAVFVQQI